MKKTKILGFELPENVAAALSYVFGFISGAIMLVLEPNNKTVRFHALQSILWFLVLALINTVLGFVLGWFLPIGRLVNAVSLLSMLFLAYNAYMGKQFKIPLIGDAVEKQIYK